MKFAFSFMCFLISIAMYSQAQHKHDVAPKNKEITREILQAFDNGDVNALDNLIAKDAVDHSEMPPDIKSTGLEAVKEMCKMQKAAFPDMKTTIHTMAATGDTVMVYFISEGTNSGMFMGMPATNKRIKMEGVDIIRFHNGKAVEHWGVYDNMKMMQQLGMMSKTSATAPPPSPPKKQ